MEVNTRVPEFSHAERERLFRKQARTMDSGNGATHVYAGKRVHLHWKKNHQRHSFSRHPPWRASSILVTFVILCGKVTLILSNFYGIVILLDIPYDTL